MFRHRLSRVFIVVSVVAVALTAAGCQSPSETDETLDVDDFVDAAGTPNPATAEVSTGRTYRVVRGNNQPDDILEYDWKVSFAVTVTLNSNAASDDVDLEFPVTITSATVKMQQASGGIVSPPTGSDAEHYESIIANSTANTFSGANTSATLWFDVWYDMPSLKKEGLATVTITFKDDDGLTFTKTVDIRVI